MTVRYATADGTAVAGSDYLPTSGALTFAPGETRKLVPVTLTRDRTQDAIVETFFLDLSDASSNAVILRHGVISIVDDDKNQGNHWGYRNSAASATGGTGTAAFGWPLWMPVGPAPAEATPTTASATGVQSPGTAGAAYRHRGGAARARRGDEAPAEALRSARVADPSALSGIEVRTAAPGGLSHAEPTGGLIRLTETAAGRGRFVAPLTLDDVGFTPPRNREELHRTDRAAVVENEVGRLPGHDRREGELPGETPAGGEWLSFDGVYGGDPWVFADLSPADEGLDR